MNSPFANFFLAIQARVQNVMPANTYIDQDMGQLKNDKGTVRLPVTWPCVLIDFEDFEFENMADNVQAAKGTVVIRLGFAPASNSSATTPDEYKMLALSYYETEFMLHKALQGWSVGDDYGNLCRTHADTQRRSDTIRVREIRYSIAFEDYSTQPQQTKVNVPIVIHGAFTV